MRKIPFERQRTARVEYKGVYVGEGRLDLLVGDKLIVDLEAVRGVAPIHKAVVVSYLKATGRCLGLLINFKVPRLKTAYSGWS